MVHFLLENHEFVGDGDHTTINENATLSKIDAEQKPWNA